MPLSMRARPFHLQPNAGDWVPAHLRRRQGRTVTPATETEVVLQPAGGVTGTASGVWQTGADEGALFVANTGAFDQFVNTEEAVGVVAAAVVQTDGCAARGAA